jgi:putative membrane protein
MNNKTDTRDALAVDRTRLANERTLLAYVRTGLSLLAAAAVLFKFFSTLDSHITAAWILADSGLLVLFIGVLRFNQMRSKLNKYQQAEQ